MAIHKIICVAVLAAFTLLSAQTAQAQAQAQTQGKPLYAWSQFDETGAPVVRAVVFDTRLVPLNGSVNPPLTCPSLTHSAGTAPMTRRSDVPPAGFEAIYVCQAAQTGLTGASVGGLSVPNPVSDPVQIAVLGDTGCRVQGSNVQNCTGNGSGPAWDYAGIAAATAAAGPDLIVHVGDMHYREYTGNCGANCDPAKLGNTWASWEADFFAPSAPLFAAAPWVPARGNHEDCGRAWTGWFYFLAPQTLSVPTWPSACPYGNTGPGGANWYYSAPVAIEFDALQIFVLDTSYIPHDTHGPPDAASVTQYRAEFDTIHGKLNTSGKPVWLVTHRPFWAVASWSEWSHRTGRTTDHAGPTDRTLQDALKGSKVGARLKGIDMMLAGHIHLMEKLSFPKTDGRPVQLVFGAGGTRLDPDLGSGGALSTDTQNALWHLGASTSDFYWTDRFDFGLITPVAGAAPAGPVKGWDVAVRAKDGSTVKSFQLMR